jgi:hypothetical protein
MRFVLFSAFAVLTLGACAPHAPHDPDILLLAQSVKITPRLEEKPPEAVMPKPAKPPNKKIIKQPKETKPQSAVVVQTPSQSTSTSTSACVTPLPNASFKAGETVMMNIIGEKDLSGLYVIDDQGLVRLPLIGFQKAAGLLPDSFAQHVTSAYKNGYLTNPVIAVTKGPSCEVKAP